MEKLKLLFFKNKNTLFYSSCILKCIKISNLPMGSLVIQLFGRKYLIRLLSVLGLLTVINKYLLSIIKINIYKYVLFS